MKHILLILLLITNLLSEEVTLNTINNNKMFSSQVFNSYQELISESINLSKNIPTYLEVVNKYFHQRTGIESNLTIATSASGTDWNITVVDGSVFTIGDYIRIGNGLTENTHPRVTAIATNLLTLDRRIDLNHAIGTPVEVSYIDMAATGLIGTISDPQEYFVAPDQGDVWYISRILFSMVHSTAGDLGLFGNLSALTNGLVMRVRIDGVYYTFTNWKTNADIKSDMFDVAFDARSGGQGSFGTSGRGTFKETGSVIRLDGDTNDTFEIYIQDNITALGFFTIKAQGLKGRE